jgi:hypothetical protein
VVVSIPADSAYLSHSYQKVSEGVTTMKALVDLFSTDYGLLSLASIVFMLGMGVFFLRLFLNKMDPPSDSGNQNK